MIYASVSSKEKAHEDGAEYSDDGHEHINSAGLGCAWAACPVLLDALVGVLCCHIVSAFVKELHVPQTERRNLLHSVCINTQLIGKLGSAVYLQKIGTIYADSHYRSFY